MMFHSCFQYPIGSMYGIFTYIWLIFMVNVGKYTVRPMDPMGMYELQAAFQRRTERILVIP